jgi:hypothetical protein
MMNVIGLSVHVLQVWRVPKAKAVDTGLTYYGVKTEYCKGRRTLSIQTNIHVKS